MPQETTPEATEAVLVITAELMAQYMKEKSDKIKDQNLSPSALSDESVTGYATDHEPKYDGAHEIKEVVDILRATDIPCCLVGESALIYYGAGRVRNDWHICVPTDKLPEATSLFQQKPSQFESFRPSALASTNRLDHLYPRFKAVGLRLFFVLLPGTACHLEPSPTFENVEFSSMGLPYPSLPTYTQSLLDGKLGTDLDDLVDGMDLNLEWGEENLDLEGTVDSNWVWWRHFAMSKTNNDTEQEDGVDQKKQRPPWYLNPDKRRDIWIKTVSPDAKKNRQGWKYKAGYETRFRRFQSQDPRLQSRDYC
ncbi:hypothetical protein FQN57_007072 [Myotisia sp. PD_48]|nr:hypothetical protein FQN57_007072 [Myotisia sp. PD_48]